MPFLKSILNYIGGQSADQSKGESNTQLINDVCVEDTEILKEKSKVEAVKTERGDSDSENNENNCQKAPAERSLNLCDNTGKDRRAFQPKESEKSKKESQSNNGHESYEEEDSFVSARGENDLPTNGSPTTIFGNKYKANDSLNYETVDSKSEVKTNVSNVSPVANEEVSENFNEEYDIDSPFEESLVSKDKEFIELTSNENGKCMQVTSHENSDNAVNHTKTTGTNFIAEQIGLEGGDDIITDADKDSVRGNQEVTLNELIDSPAKTIDLSSNCQKVIDVESVPQNFPAIEAKINVAAICSATHKEEAPNRSYSQNTVRDNNITEVVQLENQESIQASTETTIDKGEIYSVKHREDTSNTCYFQNRDETLKEVVQCEYQEAKQSNVEPKIGKAENKEASCTSCFQDGDNNIIEAGYLGNQACKQPTTEAVNKGAICSATCKEEVSNSLYLQNQEDDITEAVPLENLESAQPTIEAKREEGAIFGVPCKEEVVIDSYFQNQDDNIADAVQPENQEPKPSVADLLVNEMSNQSVSTSEISMDTDSNQCCSTSTLDRNSSHMSTPPHNVVTQQMLDEEERYEEEDKAEAEQHRNTVKEEIHAAPEDQRFERLQKLLDKSNAYARFILNKMNHQRDEEKQRREAKEKRAAEMAKKKLKDDSSKDQVVPEVDAHRTRSGTNLSDAKNRKGKRKRGADKGSEQESSQESSSGSSKRQKTSRKGKKSKIEQQFAEAEMDVEDQGNDKKVIEKQGEQATRMINGEAVSHRQPLLISGGVMRSYQLDGLDWMRGLFENGINGILADEMGLGKTLQCISLISYLVERNLRGPFLVAAPLSTLPNWVSEFKKFAPKLSTILYHGSIEERAAMRSKIAKVKRIDPDMKIKANPVVITSYEIIMRDRVHLNALPWKYIIIDEGHRIKNLNCRLIRELKTYKTANRLLLTGTPLQNNLAELWSLLNFLLPDIFDDLNSFQEWFDFSAVSEDGGDEKIIAQEQETNVLETLHAILTPFLLRRLKTDVDLSIPPKRELIVYAPLTKEQGEFYRSTLDRTILSKIREKSKPTEEIEYTPSGRPKRRSVKPVDYSTMLNEDSEDFDFDALLDQMNAEEERKKTAIEQQNSEKSKSMVSIRLQNIMMQLRKCCNHPYLLEYPLDPETQEVIVNEHLVNVSGKMQLLDRMLAELKRRGHKVLIFSQFTTMLDIIQDFCYMRSYSFSRIDGTMKVPERQEMIENFNNDPETFLFLLSTRAGGLGLNLSTADTCIIYDSDWNPQVDLQAQDRCHRIGQTKPVLIFRYVTANSIDERVVERAASKRKLEKMVIHKGHFKGKQMSSKLSPQELLDLLQSKDHSQVSGMDQDLAITDECLNQLLDRTTLLSNTESNHEPEPAVGSNLFKVVEQTQDDAIF